MEVKKYIVVEMVGGNVIGVCESLEEGYKGAESCLLHADMPSGNIVVAEVIYDMRLHKSVICELKRDTK